MTAIFILSLISALLRGPIKGTIMATICVISAYYAFDNACWIWMIGMFVVYGIIELMID